LTFVVLVVLAVVWAVVLIPPLLRSRNERAGDPIVDFNFRLDALGRTNGALRPQAVRSKPGERAAKRRREVMRVLVSAVGITALLALATNNAFLWFVQVVADLACIGFLGLWFHLRSMEEERLRKVRALPAQFHDHDDDVRWERVASS